MYSRKIINGDWIRIGCGEQYDKAFEGADIDKNKYYDGPGWYYKLYYRQSCPRGCCTDSVIELIRPDQVIMEVNKVISDYQEIKDKAQEYLENLNV